MKKAILISLVLVGCTPTPTPTQVVFTQQLIDAHNSFRVSKGKKALSLDSKLQQACEAHTLDMAKSQILSHTGTDGSTPFERITKYGYVWSLAGENVAWNQQTVDAVMSTWESDPAHLANILTDGYVNIGAACVYDISGHPYWCIDFAAPK